MSLTLAEIKSLIEALGVQIPDLILEQRAQAEKFQERQQKVLAEAANKAGDWKLKPKFDDLQVRWLKASDNNEFDLALQLLDDAEKLLGQADLPPEASLQAEPARTETPTEITQLSADQPKAAETISPVIPAAPAEPIIPDQEARREEALRKRFESLQPRLESVRQGGGKPAAELGQLLAVFESQLRSTNFERATPVLDRIERLLDEVQEADARFMRGLAEAVAALGEASRAVDEQLGALEQALKGSDDPELKLIGETGVKWIVGDHGQQLNAAIEVVEKAEPAARAAAVDRALQAVGAYLDHVEASAEIDACDRNDLGVEVAIRSTLGQALDELGQALVGA
jgi:hypothetical protein